MRITLIVSALFVLLSSCGTKKSEYKKHPSGLKYHFLEMNPEGETPQVGDILVLSLAIRNKEGKVIDANDFYRIQLARPIYKGDFNTGLSMIQVGDSISFLLDAADYYEKSRKGELPSSFERGDPVYINLRLKSLLSVEELEKERMQIYHTGEAQEEILLKDYLERTNVQEAPLSSGVYRIIQKMGKGLPARKGRRLTVHYTGTTIDGHIFDSSLQRNMPLTFTLGRNQVIPGWEVGLAGLKPGAKVRLIIPSKMAYGEKGFKSIILPYSTLVFDIEILKVE